MKKFIISGTLCALAMAGSVAAPRVVAAAETTPAKSQSEMMAQIEQLMKLIADLQAKLTEAKGQIHELMSDLSEGAQGDDVLKAQEILASDPTIFKVKPTGFFGPMTKEALMKFQERYGLEVTGKLDEATREALKELRKERKDGMVPLGLIKSDEVKDKVRARLQEKWKDCDFTIPFRAKVCEKVKDHKDDMDDDDSDDDSDDNSSSTSATREEARAAIVDAQEAVKGLKDDIDQMEDDDEDNDVIDEAEDTLNEAEKQINKARQALAKGKYDVALEAAENASDVISGDDDDSSVSDDDDDDMDDDDSDDDDDDDSDDDDN